MVSLGTVFQWIIRVSIPTSALLISGGFFFSSIKPGAEKPGRLVALIYIGGIALATGLIILGIGLIRAAT